MLCVQGRVKDAIGHYIEAVRVNSWDFQVSLTLAKLLYTVADMDRAKFMFEHASTLRPNDSYSHIVLAGIYSSQGMCMYGGAWMYVHVCGCMGVYVDA